MKKFFIKLGEVLCVFLLAAFIAYVTSADRISTVPFSEVSAAVVSVADTGQLKKRDKLEFRNKYSLQAEDYKDFIWYSSESVMDVRELVIIFTQDKADAKKVKASIEAYAENKHSLFEGYAPEESEMISSYVLVQKKGYTLFCIGQDREKVLSVFYENINN